MQFITNQYSIEHKQIQFKNFQIKSTHGQEFLSIQKQIFCNTVISIILD